VLFRTHAPLVLLSYLPPWRGDAFQSQTHFSLVFFLALLALFRNKRISLPQATASDNKLTIPASNPLCAASRQTNCKQDKLQQPWKVAAINLLGALTRS